MKKAALVLGIVVAAGAIVAFLAMAFTKDELQLCRTCGAERLQTTRLGSAVDEHIKDSTLDTFARERFDVRHAHRWTSRDDFVQATDNLKMGFKNVVLRPIDDKSRAAAISIAQRMEAYRAGLGVVFLKTWLDPDDAAESEFKTNYLNLLVQNETRLMRDPTDEHMTIELYAPLLVLPKIEPKDETKLKVWVALQMEKK